MIKDDFRDFADSASNPARSCAAVIPDDVNQLDIVSKALYIGTGGDLVIRSVDADADVTLRNAASGTILPMRVIAVRSTGTSAADIVALF